MGLSRQDVEELLDSKMEHLTGQINGLVSNIRRESRLNYLNLIANSLEAEAKERVNSFKCKYGDHQEKKCKSTLNAYIAEYTQTLAQGDLDGALDVLDELEEAAEKFTSKFDNDSGCKEDWSHISEIVKKHKEIAQTQAQINSGMITPSISDTEFDVDEMYNNFIFPLSHELRLNILNALIEGPKRFTELKDQLDVKNTGLLVHHLKPLTETDLVVQDYKKEYSLSDKGTQIVRELGKIQKLLDGPGEELIPLDDAVPKVHKFKMVDQ